MQKINYKLAFEIYWPVVEAAELLKEKYVVPESGEPKNCCDLTKDLIRSLKSAQKRLLISKETEVIERRKFKLN